MTGKGQGGSWTGSKFLPSCFGFQPPGTKRLSLARHSRSSRGSGEGSAVHARAQPVLQTLFCSIKNQRARELRLCLKVNSRYQLLWLGLV